MFTKETIAYLALNSLIKGWVFLYQGSSRESNTKQSCEKCLKSRGLKRNIKEADSLESINHLIIQAALNTITVSLCLPMQSISKTLDITMV